MSIMQNFINKYFGTKLGQAPLNEHLGQAAYMDMEPLTTLVHGAPKLVSNDRTAFAGNSLQVDTSARAVTIKLPENPKINDRVGLMSWNHSWDINNFIVDPQGLKINGVVDTVKVDLSRPFTLTYTGETNGWVIVP